MSPILLATLATWLFVPLPLWAFQKIPLLVDPSSIDARGVYAIKENAEYVLKKTIAKPRERLTQSINPLTQAP